MKIHLVYPSMAGSPSQLFGDSVFLDVLRSLFGLGRLNITPPLSLLMLGAVTPRNEEVRLIDERVDSIDFDDPVDLVGISTVTVTAPRAYEIADEYRRRGVKVVLGGVHPSVLPQEASAHADSTVVGEGETVWPQIIQDCREKRLKPIYYGGHGADLAKLPRARRELIAHPEWYFTLKIVAASRGCPNGCAFCSAGVAVGKRYRTRPVSDVIEEIQSIPGRLVFFADDNLGWDIAYTKTLLRALVPLNIAWMGELSLQALEDDELVELVAKSGCRALGLGFESLSPEVIASIRKDRTNDPRRYPELIRRLHRRGVPILGHFIVGFDDDDENVFDGLITFFRDACLDMPSLATLLPYPGTTVFRQFEREGRLLHKNWGNYNTAGDSLVYRPKHMTSDELRRGYTKVAQEVFGTGATLRRLMRAKMLFSLNSLSVLHYNRQSRHSTLQDLKKTSPSQIKRYTLEADPGVGQSTAS